MITISAKSTEEAEKILSSGTAAKVLLEYAVTTDDFFRLADTWCAQGAKILKKEGVFSVSLKGFRIPPND